MKRSSIVVLLMTLTAGAYWLVREYSSSENRGVASSETAVVVTKKPASEKPPEGVPTKLPEKKSAADEYTLKLVKDKKAPKSKKKKTVVAETRAEPVQIELPQETQTVAFAPEAKPAPEAITSAAEVKVEKKAKTVAPAKLASALEVKNETKMSQESTPELKSTSAAEVKEKKQKPVPLATPTPAPVVVNPPPVIAPPPPMLAPPPPVALAPTEEPTFLDRITFSPTLVYFLAKTRNSSGQEAQLASRVSTGISMTLEQRWSEDFTTNARMGFLQYDFQGIDGMEIKNAKSSSFNGEFAARSRLTEKSTIGARLMLDENFLVGADTTTGGLKVEKLTRPAIGAFYEGTLWSGRRGHIALVPHLTYVAGASANGVSTDSHFSYGFGLKGEKLASKFFSATGFEFGYETGKFGTSIGSSTNTILRFQINFSFDF